MIPPGRSAITHPPTSPVVRLLAFVTEVRPAETTTALLMTLNGFLLLMAYSCIKPLREALILEHPGGAEYKVYMAAATAVVLLAAVPAYARASRNLTRNQLVVGVTLFFASHLVGLFVLARALGNSLPLALGFYLWVAVFNMMIVAQFWAFANDLYNEADGKRLFPLFGLGTSIGAVAGAAVAKTLISRVGSLEMMPVAAVLLVASAGVAQWAHRREVSHPRDAESRAAASSAIGGTAGEGFRTVLAQRYLLLIALFSLVFTMVKTNGDYVLARIVEDAAHQAVAAGTLHPDRVRDYIGGFFAGYTLWVDILSLVLQGVVVSRLVKYFGIGFAFMILPVVAVADATIMTVWPLLAAVRVGKTVESGIDYSVNNTVRNLLWLPTSRRAKYLAKQATDTFFVRAGDVSSALLVFLGIELLGGSTRAIAVANIALAGVWLLLARAIVKEHAGLHRVPPTAESAKAA